MNKLYSLVKHSFLCLTLLLIVVGCASTVNRNLTTTKESSTIKEEVIQVVKYEPLKGLAVSLNSNAQNKLADNSNFSLEKLQARINSTLIDSQYLKVQGNNSNYRMEVVITDIRVRSGAAAILLGFLAGADSITGQVYVKNGDKVIDNFEVDISYAFGGAMGDTDTRMSWMYESFSTKILEELKKLMPKS